MCAAPVSTLSVTAAARTCRRTRLTPPGYMPCALPPGRSARTTRLPPPGGRTCALGALGTLGACLPAELRHGPGLGEHVPAAPAELLHVRERPRSGLGEPASVKQACRIRFWRRCSPVGCVKIQISFEFFKKKTVFPSKKRPLTVNTGSHKVRQSDSLSDRDSGWPDSGSESLGRLPPPGPGPRPSRPRRCWRDGIQKVRSHKVTKKKATGARKRIWRCSTPWKLYVPEVNCTSGALAPAFVMEHALCVSNMHLIARDMQFCSPTCMFCVEHAL